MDGMLGAVGKKKTEWNGNLYFTVKFAGQEQSHYHAEVTPLTGTVLISAHICDLFQKLWFLWMSVMTIHIHPQNKIFKTTQYLEKFPKYVVNEHCLRHQWISVTIAENVPGRNSFPFAMVSGFHQLSFDAYDFSSHKEEYVMPRSVAEMTPGRSNRAARFVTAGWLNFNSLPQLPYNWG